MKFNLFVASCTAALCLSTPLAADGHGPISIEDPYARASSAMAKSGAIFMVIKNAGEAGDTLIAASAPVAKKVELHTHVENEQGVMQMLEVEEGFSVPAGGMHHLKRGGDHVMLMGLTESLEDGKSFPLTLTFEEAGEITIDVPVDLTRKPKHGHGHGHMNH